MTSRNTWRPAAGFLQICVIGEICGCLPGHFDGNLLIKHEYRGTDPWSPQATEVNNEKYFLDYKAVSGVQTPSRLEVHQDGKKVVELELSDICYHERLDDSTFAKP